VVAGAASRTSPPAQTAAATTRPAATTRVKSVMASTSRGRTDEGPRPPV